MPNTYSQIYHHIIFAPKHRQGLILPEFEERVFQYITGITKTMNQKLIQINGMADHLHLLVRLRPSIAPSTFVQKIKTNSSRWINTNNFLPIEFNWQTGGGIFSVDYRHVSVVAKYIKFQKEHHEKLSFKTEYIKILEKYGIEYEDKYLLDFL